MLSGDLSMWTAYLVHLNNHDWLSCVGFPFCCCRPCFYCMLHLRLPILSWRFPTAWICTMWKLWRWSAGFLRSTVKMLGWTEGWVSVAWPPQGRRSWEFLVSNPWDGVSCQLQGCATILTYILILLGFMREIVVSCSISNWLRSMIPRARTFCRWSNWRMFFHTVSWKLYGGLIGHLEIQRKQVIFLNPCCHFMTNLPPGFWSGQQTTPIWKYREERKRQNMSFHRLKEAEGKRKETWLE